MDSAHITTTGRTSSSDLVQVRKNIASVTDGWKLCVVEDDDCLRLLVLRQNGAPATPVWTVHAPDVGDFNESLSAISNYFQFNISVD